MTHENYPLGDIPTRRLGREALVRWWWPFSLIPFLQCTGTPNVLLQCVLVNVILGSIKPFKNEMITTATHNSIDRVINVVLAIY